MRYRRVRIPGGRYFFTQVTAKRKPLLADRAAVELLMHCFGYVQQRRSFEIEAYAILPDHIHALWSLPDGDSDYSTRWMLVKTTFSRKYREQFEIGAEAIWQPRYWEHSIRDDRDYVTHVEYIHLNPVRHGLAAAPKDWEHSSFRLWVADGVYPLDWAIDYEPEFKTTEFGE